jgi:DNA polymerase
MAKHFERDEIFMDIDSIQPGKDFVQVLEEAVSACDVFLAIIGPAWLNAVDDAGRRRLDQWDDFVRLEIANALKFNKVVIPVLVGRARMPSPADLPDDLKALARRNAIELSHQHFAFDVDKLIQVVKSTTAKEAFKPRADAEKIRQKEQAIKALRLELVGADKSPLYKNRIENRYFPVLGDGNADANIVFIGEAPGKSEVETGRPFVGPSGEVLDDMLLGIGLRRADVFLTNVLLDRPPDQRDPLQEEIAFYAPFVDRLIDIIQPAVIVTLGAFAMQYIMKKLDVPEKNGKISSLHGKLMKARLSYGEIHVVPLYHPAVVLYSASQKEILRKDFEKLKMFV